MYTPRVRIDAWLFNFDLVENLISKTCDTAWPNRFALHIALLGSNLENRSLAPERFSPKVGIWRDLCSHILSCTRWRKLHGCGSTVHQGFRHMNLDVNSQHCQQFSMLLCSYPGFDSSSIIHHETQVLTVSSIFTLLGVVCISAPVAQTDLVTVPRYLWNNFSGSNTYDSATTVILSIKFPVNRLLGAPLFLAISIWHGGDPAVKDSGHHQAHPVSAEILIIQAMWWLIEEQQNHQKTHSGLTKHFH
jgi:hypothetical protein